MPARTVPTVPTRLVGIEVVDRPAMAKRGVSPVTVLGTGMDGALRYGPDAESLVDGWTDAAVPTGKAGEVRTVPGTTGRLMGIGDGRPVDWRTAGAALARSVADAGEDGPATVEVAPPDDVTEGEIEAFVLGVLLGGYRFRVTADRKTSPLRLVRLCLHSEIERMRTVVRRTAELAAATALARDLANMPPNIKDPAWLADVSARTLAGLPGLTVTVRDEAWLAKHGFGGVLAVGGGSARPPRFLELAWRPRGAAKAPHLALVGKGITFDTGGISLKRAPGSMHLMATDMSGGGAVIAALGAIARLGVPVRVTGLVPIAENHFSGSAYRPGDVVRHYDGSTTEVTNTDAEGRMVLADAIGYAIRVHKPDLLVDVATLTGAMKISLGLRTGGLFAGSDPLAEYIAEAGREVGEAWWRMPLCSDSDTVAAEFGDAVRSDIADHRQVPRGAGGIAAAHFLREFTGGVAWAHLDIAGPARSDKTYAEVVPGGTGFAARTLVALAERLARPDSHPSFS